MTAQQRTDERRVQIGADILRSLNHDERTALDLWLAATIGAAVEDTISGMRCRDLREFIGASAIEDMAREIGMSYDTDRENVNAGCDPITM